MAEPEVTVVIPVYNTRRYLTRCLRSLVDQTIGLDRMEVIAVDDGSTDGSARVLDRFARQHPGAFTVIHQPNSGGPAGPCNRALDVATGRYVFFLGSDDCLGPETLQRLVAAADQYGSDIVLGRVVGVNSRSIDQDVFVRTEVDIGLHDSALPRSLGNTKLFRRELLERFGIRYPEHMPEGSDLPFTLEACYRAGRVSVLADYDYYYLVRRLDAGNISYTKGTEQRLRVVEQSLAFAVGLIEPGKQRDAVILGRFQHEIAQLVGDELLRADRDGQRFVHSGVSRLAAGYLREDLADQLGSEVRVRVAVARHGELDDLLAVIQRDAETGGPPTVVDGPRRYAGYPGFRDPSRGLPDTCFDVTTAADWPVRFAATAAVWHADGGGDAVLAIAAHNPADDLSRLGVDGLAAHAEDVPARIRVSAASQRGTEVRIDVRLRDLLDASAATGQRRAVLVRNAAAGGAAGAVAPVRAPGLTPVRPRVCRRGTRFYVVTPTRDASGRLMISVVPVTARRVMAHARRFVGGGR